MPHIEVSSLFKALDVLTPMHVFIDCDGAIRHVGPTARHFCKGANFSEAFEIVKPANTSASEILKGFTGKKLVLSPRGETGLSLTGVVAPLKDGFLLNLSLGLDVVDIVRRYNLTATDFAPTDLSVGIIYLTEAKSIAIEEYKRLNMRLNGAKTRAEQAAQTDELTGLSNLRALREELVVLQNSGECFAIMTLDLDHFKAVNDNLGHAAGDHVLKETARILREETRNGDLVARNGGDEFTLLLKGVHDRETTVDIAERIIDRIEQPVTYGTATCHISASIGTIFSNDSHVLDIEEMLSNADKALYSSKRSGRGRNTVYSCSKNGALARR